MEYVRSLRVVVTIDTNKGTYEETFTRGEDEDYDDVLERVAEFVHEHTGQG
jgi:hypothetical protein